MVDPACGWSPRPGRLKEGQRPVHFVSAAEERVRCGAPFSRRKTQEGRMSLRYAPTWEPPHPTRPQVRNPASGYAFAALPDQVLHIGGMLAMAPLNIAATHHFTMGHPGA